MIFIIRWSSTLVSADCMSVDVGRYPVFFVETHALMASIVEPVVE